MVDHAPGAHVYDNALDYVDIDYYSNVDPRDFLSDEEMAEFEAEQLRDEQAETGDGADPSADASSAEPLNPNTAAIQAHIEWLISPALERYGDAKLEIAWDHAGDGNPTRAQLFHITEVGVAEAVKVAARVNENAEDCRCNVYLGMMLKKPETRSKRRTRALDCYVATAVPVDIDRDVETTNAALEAVAQPGLTVRTGTTPQPREQKWCQLKEPCANPALVEQAFKSLVEHVGGDHDARGAYRLMRLGGSVNYPSPRKQTRGYVVERTAVTIEPTASPVDIHMLAALLPKDKPKLEEAKGAKEVASEASSDAVDISFDDFAAAVRAIPNTDDAGLDRGEWLKIRMAIRHHLGDDETAFKLFDEWSRAHSSYDEGDTKTAWKSFAKPYNGKPITALSILKMARKHGWRPLGEPKHGAQAEVDGYISFGEYVMREGGLWLQIYNDKGKVTREVLISSAFKILSKARDFKSGSWGKILEFSDSDGVVKREHFADADMHNALPNVIARLADAGLTS
jgi:hypothetical protein